MGEEADKNEKRFPLFDFGGVSFLPDCTGNRAGRRG
jgi:hypothetical protein